MSYYKNSYSTGDTFIDYSGNKYTVVTGGNTPSTPFDSSNIVNDKIVWGSLELEPLEQGGGGTVYTQVLAIDVADASSSSPYLKNLVITPTNKFILPPIDVLQESIAESATITVSSFNSEDASKFNYDNDYVEFDGSLHLKTEYNIQMSTPTIITDGTTTGYISESDNIDFGDFANVEGVDVG